MFESLKAVNADPILGLMAAFRADPREKKIDLGVGIYQNDRGITPVMDAIKRAEAKLFELENTKAYQGIAGDPEFNRLTLELMLGAEHAVLKDARAASLQTPGGSGGLRVGAELIRRANPEAKLWVGVPTWPNHIPLLGSAGFKIQEYAYYDHQKRGLNFDAMHDALAKVPAGDIVLLHGCCHNPTGADLSPEQWRGVTALAEQRGFIPFIDIAYQGLGDGLHEDAYGLRLMASAVPELVIAFSGSKNFGVYRERTGSVVFVGKDSDQASKAGAQAMVVARQIYSMPPAHGALLVSLVLGDAALRENWQRELEETRLRIVGMRQAVTDALRDNAAGMDFSHIAQQKGMFSFLGVTAEQVVRLREDFGVYMLDSTRINLAGINSGNLDYLLHSLQEVLTD